MKSYVGGLLILLAACGGGGGGGACDGDPIVGTYKGNVVGQSDTLVFNADCTVTSSYCASTATYPSTKLTTGNVQITTTVTAGKTGCLPTGATSCSFIVDGGQLGFNCGNSTLIYEKQ